MATTTVDLDEYRQLVSTNEFLTSEAKRFSKEAHDTRENNQALMVSEGALQKEVADQGRLLKQVGETADQRWEDLQSAYKDRNLWKDRYKDRNREFRDLKDGFTTQGIDLARSQRELRNLKAKYDLDQE